MDNPSKLTPEKVSPSAGHSLDERKESHHGNARRRPGENTGNERGSSKKELPTIREEQREDHGGRRRSSAGRPGEGSHREREDPFGEEEHHRRKHANGGNTHDMHKMDDSFDDFGGEEKKHKSRRRSPGGGYPNQGNHRSKNESYDFGGGQDYPEKEGRNRRRSSGNSQYRGEHPESSENSDGMKSGAHVGHFQPGVSTNEVTQTLPNEGGGNTLQEEEAKQAMHKKRKESECSEGLKDLILGYKHHIKGGKIDDIDINDMMLRDRRVSLKRYDTMVKEIPLRSSQNDHGNVFYKIYPTVDQTRMSAALNGKSAKVDGYLTKGTENTSYYKRFPKAIDDQFNKLTLTNRRRTNCSNTTTSNPQLKLNDDGQNVFVDKFMSNNIDFCGRRQKMATGKLQGVFNTFKSNHEMCQQAPYDDFDSNALVPQSTKSAFQFNKCGLQPCYTPETNNLKTSKSYGAGILGNNSIDRESYGAPIPDNLKTSKSYGSRDSLKGSKSYGSGNHGNTTFDPETATSKKWTEKDLDKFGKSISRLMLETSKITQKLDEAGNTLNKNGGKTSVGSRDMSLMIDEAHKILLSLSNVEKWVSTKKEQDYGGGNKD